MSNKKKLVIIGCALVLSIFVGMSYAYWYMTKVQTEKNRVTTGCLSLALKNESDAINLSSAVPTSDEDALKLDAYTFTLENVCDGEANYQINLETLNDTTLNEKYVKVLFGLNPATKLTDFETTDKVIEDALSSRKLEVGTLSGKESKDFSLRLYLGGEEATDSDSMNKRFEAKVTVSSSNVTNEVIAFNGKCRRAKTLHKEICNLENGCINYWDPDNKSTVIVENGEFITYGNLGTPGELNLGDAFTCDVNGDGVYDEQTERFYYLDDTVRHTYVEGQPESDKYVDGYAMLVYYTNVSEGLPDSTSLYTLSPSWGYTGNALVVSQLPSSTQWNNVDLLVQNRRANFNYENKSARILSINDVSICTDRTLINLSCSFLAENTSLSDENKSFGYWLETDDIGVGSVMESTPNGSSNLMVINPTSGFGEAGVRPAIDVLKTDMEI